MQYVYLAMAVITSGYSGVCYKKASFASGNRVASIILPELWFAPLALAFGICALFTGGISIHREVIFPALLAGAAAAICGYSLLESMKSNSYSLAIIIVNLSFVFPVLLSMIFLNESAHLLQLVGMLLAIAVILLLNMGKQKGTNATALLLAVMSSLGNGLITFSIKIQQHYTPGENICSFFFFTYLFAVVLSIAAYLGMRLLGHKVKLDKAHKKELLFNAPAIAVCNGTCFLFTGLLTGWMNAAAEFTVITSLSIIISLAVGWIRMKERLGKREIFSVVFCAVAIACQYLNLL